MIRGPRKGQTLEQDKSKSPCHQITPATSAKEQPGHEDGRTGSEPQCGPSHQTDCNSHSRKEQKRRLHIRTSCQHLCDLLPFVDGQLDTATTLELTAKYMSYLKQTLPQDMLSKVDKAVKENIKGSWKKSKAPKKRKTCRLKRSPSKKTKPVAKKSTDANYLGRPIQPKNPVQVNPQSITITSPLMMEQALPPFVRLTTVHAPPILLDESSVPRGQVLPVCQNQCQVASLQSVESNWITSPSVFLSSISSPITMTSQDFQFEVKLGPSSSHAVRLEQCDATLGLVNPTALRPLNSDQASMPLDQFTSINFITPPAEQSQMYSPLVSLDENISADVLNQPLVPPLLCESAAYIGSNMTSERSDHPMLELLCNSGPSPTSFSSLSSKSNPLTSSPQDTSSPFWLDVMLDTNDTLGFPDTRHANRVFSP